jgi:hypothetical protein
MAICVKTSWLISMKHIYINVKSFARLVFSFLFVASFVLTSILPYPVYAVTTTLTVTGEGSDLYGTYPAGVGNWNDVTNDDADVSYLRSKGTDPQNHTYTVSPFGAAFSEVNSVTLYVKSRSAVQTFPPNYDTIIITPVVKIGGVNNYGGGGYTAGDGSYTTFTATWLTNPTTGAKWCATTGVSEINSSEFGLRSANYGISTELHTTYIYIVVDYTVATSPTVTTQAVSAVTSTTATGNGNVTSDGGSVITERGTVIALAANPTTADHKDTAAGTTGVYTTSIATLTKGTLYHVRAYAINAIGTSYGADVSFTTVGDSIVSTVAASLVSSTTARLNSQVVFDGATTGTENCTVTFVYAAGSGYANYNAVLAAPGHIETVVVGNYTTGQFPYLDITGLVVATTYSFSVKIINSTATTAYGGVLTFLTESGVYTPTEFSAISSGTTISLLWAKGVGAQYTYCRYSDSTYPALITDGVEGYNGTGNSVQLTGLNAGTTYYFSIWGRTGIVYSATYISALATTGTATDASVTIPPAYYATPPQFFQTPDYTKMSAFPLYGLVNWGVDIFEIPRNTAWFTLAMIFAMGIGILIYRLSTNIPAASFSIALTIFMCSMMGLMEMWLLVPFVLIGIGAWAQGSRA